MSKHKLRYERYIQGAVALPVSLFSCLGRVQVCLVGLV